MALSLLISSNFLEGVLTLDKYIVFDFDGTLVDSMERSIKVINQLAAKYGFETLTIEQIEQLRKYSIVDRCKMLNFPLYKIPFAVVDFLKLYRSSTDELCFFDGIQELLTNLTDQGFKVAIISSNSEETIREYLQKNDLTSVSDVICSNNIFGKDKTLKKFMKKHQLKKSDVIYVGDELRDIVACKQVGIKIIWVNWGFDAIDVTEKQQPDYIVKEPKEILTVAKNLQF